MIKWWFTYYLGPDERNKWVNEYHPPPRHRYLSAGPPAVAVDAAAAAAVKRPLAIEKKPKKEKKTGCKAEGIGEYSAGELRQMRAQWRSKADR